MFRKIISSAAIILTTIFSSSTEAAEVKRTKETEKHLDFHILKPHHEFSQSENFDGIACIVMALNALQINLNHYSALGDQIFFNQENIFNAQTLSITMPEIVAKRGVAMEEMTQILQVYGLKAKAQYPHIMTAEALKETIMVTLKDPNTLMIVHFDETHLTMKTGVHYAVVAGYDEKTDMVLLFSPDSTGSAKRWVKTTNLLKGMQALDENHTPRGFILAQKPMD